MKKMFSKFVVLSLAAFGAVSGYAAADVTGKVVICLDRVNTSSWQAFPLKDGEPLPEGANSTVWGKQTLLVADKFVGSAGVGGPVQFAFFKKGFISPAEKALFIGKMKEGKASAIGFLSLTVDAPLVEDNGHGGILVTQKIAYKLMGDNGRVWTAGIANKKVSGRRKSSDSLLVAAMDETVSAVVRQITMKMQL